MPVTIKDIAKRTGLSPATVSRAINRSGYVSQRARDLVDLAVAELSYQPNWLARGLKGKPTRLVGLNIPDILNVFYTNVAQAIATSLREHGYEMILCVSGDSQVTDLGYLQVLEQKRVDGIIYTHPAGPNNSSFVRQLSKRGVPIVELNRRTEEDLLDAVLADNFGGAYQAVDYLLSKGHRRIAMICGNPNLTTGKHRIQGYTTALNHAGFEPEPDLVKIGTFSRDYGEQATEELLSLAAPPTAIFATSNRIALGALVVLARRGVKIPEDLSFIAFDDVEWMSAWRPPITTVDIAVEEMARLAVDLLLRRTKSDNDGYKPITYKLSTKLIERESCRDLAND